MHFLYVGYYVDDRILYEIQKRKINNMSVARQNFERNLLNNLVDACAEGDAIDFVSYVPVDSVFSVPEFSYLKNARIRHIPINKKSLFSMLKAMKSFQGYLKSLGDNKLRNLRVIMYDVNPVFLIPIMMIKSKYGIKTTSICAEVPALRRSRNVLSKIKHAALSVFMQKCDGYILFAKAMVEKLQCSQKPWTVVEGIAPPNFGVPVGDKANIVMYAGGLAADNNIRQLIDCCIHMPEIKELWICGCGPEQDYVVQKSKEYEKIKYFGMVENETVRKMETQAKVLVNLRSPEAELTWYSFPSKLLEYMASGSFVISTRLKGIPEEYFDYVCSLPIAEEESLRNAMKDVFKMKNEEYVSRCAAAQMFIQGNKNAETQAKKIIDFVYREFPID